MALASATRSEETAIQIWDGVSGQEKHTLPFGNHSKGPVGPPLVFSQDGKRLALLSQIWQEKIIFFRKVEGDTLQVGHTSGT